MEQLQTIPTTLPVYCALCSIRMEHRKEVMLAERKRSRDALDELHVIAVLAEITLAYLPVIETL